MNYYQQMYKEEMLRKDNQDNPGMLSSLKNKFGLFYKSVFGHASPLDPAEEKTVQDTPNKGIVDDGIEDHITCLCPNAAEVEHAQCALTQQGDNSRPFNQGEKYTLQAGDGQ